MLRSRRAPVMLQNTSHANDRTPTVTPTRYIWSAHVPEPSGPPMTPACMKPTADATRHDPASARKAQIRLRSRKARIPHDRGEPDHQDQPDRHRDVVRRRVVGQRGHDRRDDGDEAADERHAAIRPPSSHAHSVVAGPPVVNGRFGDGTSVGELSRARSPGRRRFNT